MSKKGGDGGYRMMVPVNFEAMLAQAQHAQDTIDLMTGRHLREALAQAGPYGRVLVTQLHDEITFTVESGT